MRLGLILTAIGLAAAISACGFAFVCGRRLERQVAAVVAAGWVASLSAQIAAEALDPHTTLAIIDGIVLALLVSLAWKPGRAWPLIAVVFQTLALAVDLVRMTTPSMHSWAYLCGLAVAAYGLLGALTMGTAQAVLARHRSARRLAAANTN